jgi:hypothetical protein
MKFSRGNLVNILCCYVAFAEDEPSRNWLFVSEEKTSEMLVKQDNLEEWAKRQFILACARRLSHTISVHD